MRTTKEGLVMPFSKLAANRRQKSENGLREARDVPVDRCARNACRVPGNRLFLLVFHADVVRRKRALLRTAQVAIVGQDLRAAIDVLGGIRKIRAAAERAQYGLTWAGPMAPISDVTFLAEGALDEHHARQQLGGKTLPLGGFENPARELRRGRPADAEAPYGGVARSGSPRRSTATGQRSRPESQTGSVRRLGRRRARPLRYRQPTRTPASPPAP